MFAPDDEAMLDCLKYLASEMDAQGKYEESEKIMREIILAKSLSHGTEHPKVLVHVHNLCRSLYSQGKYIECGLQIRKVFAAHSKIFGLEHPDTLTTQLLFGRLLYSQRQLVEGENVLRSASEKCRRVLGPYHDHALQADGYLADILMAKRLFLDAEVLGKRVMNQKGKSSASRLTFISCIRIVGKAQFGQGRIEEGRSILEEAVHEAKTCLGEKHPFTKVCVSEYTMLAQDLGRMSPEALIAKWMSRWYPEVEEEQSQGSFDNIRS